MRLPSSTDKIYADVEGRTGQLIIDHPAKRNAMTLAMWEAVPSLISMLDSHPDVRVIVMRGAEASPFCAGADIAEFETVRATAAGARAYEAANARAFEAVAAASKPVIAMIRAFCLGGGFGLAAACDLRVAAEGALFGVPAGRLGVGYPPEAVGMLVALLGPAAVKDLFFTARRIDTTEAATLRFLDRVVPEADLEKATRQLADAIADNAPLTLRAAKRAIDHWAGAAHAGDLATLRKLADACFDSEDYREGRAAFMEKRTAVFRGR